MFRVDPCFVDPEVYTNFLGDFWEKNDNNKYHYNW